MKIADVSTTDRAIYDLFVSTEPLGVTPEDIFAPCGTYGIPSSALRSQCRCFRTRGRRTSPTFFRSRVCRMVRTYGSATRRISSKTEPVRFPRLSERRDNIMVYLLHKGVEPSLAFKIMEITRKGNATKLFDDTIYQAFKDNNVPDWYVESCKKIKYMFPKAHAAAYVTSAVKLCWFKINRPCEFYAATLTKHTENIELDVSAPRQGSCKEPYPRAAGYAEYRRKGKGHA